MSNDQAQAEHDIHVLRTLINDLLLDWRTPDGHLTLIDNAHLIENAMDDLSRMVESIRRSSTAYTVDLRTLETV